MVHQKQYWSNLPRYFSPVHIFFTKLLISLVCKLGKVSFVKIFRQYSSNTISNFLVQVVLMFSQNFCTNHSDSHCWISFVNWFWHLIVGNRSIGLNFYQQRPVFALKFFQRPQRSKRPMKARKGHQRPELQKIIDFINIQCKIINKWECNTKKKLFFKNWKFSFS